MVSVAAAAIPCVVPAPATAVLPAATAASAMVATISTVVMEVSIPIPRGIPISTFSWRFVLVFEDARQFFITFLFLERYSN